MTGHWYHRGPCCRPCSICGRDEHFVRNPQDGREIHVCTSGCDGWPPALWGVFA
jgi:hypothetical protein